MERRMTVYLIINYYFLYIIIFFLIFNIFYYGGFSMDYANFPPFAQFDMPDNEMYKDPMFNPIAQYEQAYTYYKYIFMQMDYKIKCKEYEKLCECSRSVDDRRSTSSSTQKQS